MPGFVDSRTGSTSFFLLHMSEMGLRFVVVMIEDDE